MYTHYLKTYMLICTNKK